LKNSRRGHAILLGIFAITMLLFSARETAIVAALIQAPFWVHVIIVAIIISGYFTIKTSAEERKTEESWIEQEGQVYMDRIKEAREQRGMSKEG